MSLFCQKRHFASFAVSRSVIRVLGVPANHFHAPGISPKPKYLKTTLQVLYSRHTYRGQGFGRC